MEAGEILFNKGLISLLEIPGVIVPRTDLREGREFDV